SRPARRCRPTRSRASSRRSRSTSKQTALALIESPGARGAGKPLSIDAAPGVPAAQLRTAAGRLGVLEVVRHDRGGGAAARREVQRIERLADARLDAPRAAAGQPRRRGLQRYQVAIAADHQRHVEPAGAANIAEVVAVAALDLR